MTYRYCLEPIVDLAAQIPQGHELLLRETHPRTCFGWRAWYRRLPHIVARHTGTLYVNFDSLHLLDRRICKTLFGLAGAPLVIEWTEYRTTRADPVAVARVLSDLRNACGFQIAFDDGGSGEDVLGRMSLLRPDIVKIARELFRRTEASRLTAGLIELAHEQGAVVVAEGIEREADRIRAKEMGCDAGQGRLWDAKHGIAPTLAARFLCLW